MNPMTPGNETSEGKRSLIIVIVSIVLPALVTLLEQVRDTGVGGHWVGPALMAVGLVTAMLTQLGYNNGRAQVKIAAIQGGLAAPVTPEAAKVPLDQTTVPTSPILPKPATLPYAP